MLIRYFKVIYFICSVKICRNSNDGNCPSLAIISFSLLSMNRNNRIKGNIRSFNSLGFNEDMKSGYRKHNLKRFFRPSCNKTYHIQSFVFYVEIKLLSPHSPIPHTAKRPEEIAILGNNHANACFRRKIWITYKTGSETKANINNSNDFCTICSPDKLFIIAFDDFRFWSRKICIIRNESTRPNLSFPEIYDLSEPYPELENLK